MANPSPSEDDGGQVNPENKEATGTGREVANRQKLRWLWTGLAVYFFIVLYALPHAFTLPYQILVLAGILNMAITISVVLSMRRVYRRMRGQSYPANRESSLATSSSASETDRRRLRFLWIGVISYSLIFLNGLGYAGKVPLPIFALGGTISAVIVTTLILTMTRIYKRLRH
jgi:hypothetical protein